MYKFPYAFQVWCFVEIFITKSNISRIICSPNKLLDIKHFSHWRHCTNSIMLSKSDVLLKYLLQKWHQQDHMLSQQTSRHKTLFTLKTLYKSNYAFQVWCFVEIFITKVTLEDYTFNISSLGSRAGSMPCDVEHFSTGAAQEGIMCLPNKPLDMKHFPHWRHCARVIPLCFHMLNVLLQKWHR